MAIRMTGLNSGLDTDSIVQALMSAQRMKQTKIENKKTKLEWKKDVWSSLNTKLYNFYKNSLANIRMQGTYKAKAATSSDNSKVTATATSSASEGTYRVKVNSLASAQYVTSGRLKANDADGKEVKVTSKTKLVDLQSNGGDSFKEGSQIVIESKSKKYMLLVDENTTVNDFVSLAKEAGLTASFDETQQRLFIGSSTSGADQAFSITMGQLSDDQSAAVEEWKEAIGYSYLSTADKAAVTKLFDQLQTGEKSADDVREKLQNYAAKAAKSGVNSYYKDKYTKEFQNQYFDNYDDTDNRKVSEEGKKALIDSMVSDKVTREQAEEKVNGMSEKDLSSKVSALVTKKVNERMKEEADTIASYVENGVPGTEADASDFLKSSALNRASEIGRLADDYYDTMKDVTDASNGLAALGLGKVDGSAIEEGAPGNSSGMVVVAASDASISYNGATLTSSTSSLTINGLTLNILDVTEGSEITISVTKDTSAVYDTIKDFLTEYNSILTEMNTKYNAASAKGYDVLTDEQKEAMTDDEVEKWEDKIKDSLLRRDDTLSSLMSVMRNAMTNGYVASDGKRYSLASLGISTSTDYAEGGMLHIWGDEDDDVYMDKENKLEKLLNQDPELVTEILTGIASGLYDQLQKKMSRSTLSSALTFYNDKEMDKQISQYKDDIKKWTAKLNDMEDRYYSQFTAMEKALASLQSQQNSLANMLG